MKKLILSRLCYMLLPCSALLMAGAVRAEESKTNEGVEADIFAATNELSEQLVTLLAQADETREEQATEEQAAEADREEAQSEEAGSQEDEGERARGRDDRGDRARRRDDRGERARGEMRRGPRGPRGSRGDQPDWSRRGPGRPEGEFRGGRDADRRGSNRQSERQLRERRREGSPAFGPSDRWRDEWPGRPDRQGADGRRDWRSERQGPPFPSRSYPPRVAGQELRQLRSELQALRGAIEALTAQLQSRSALAE